MTTVSDFRAILGFLDHSEERWNAHVSRKVPVFVSYSFLKNSELPAPDSLAYSAATTASYSAAQRTAFRKALATFEKVTGVVFVETTGEAMIQAHAVTGSQWGGWASYPWVSNFSTSTGTLVLDHTRGENLSGFRFEVMLHELGHALGLSHTFEGKYTLNSAIDSTNTSVMSYNWSSTPHTTLRPMDIKALKHIYGKSVDTTGWSYGFKNDVFKASGAAGDDQMIGVWGKNTLSGKRGDDLLIGREDMDILKGGDGNDVLRGFAGADRMEGGLGRDVLWASSSGVADYTSNVLLGGGGNDQLFGQAGADTLKGGDGNDRLLGQSGNDKMLGGTGADVLDGGDWSDRIWGDEGNDKLFGRNGDDKLDGGRHADVLVGGHGWDQLRGNAGRDTLTGGSGSDQFIFRKAAAGSRDTITDFELGLDQLLIGGTGFAWEDAILKRANGGADTVLIFEGDGGFSIHFEGVVKSDLEAEILS